MFGSSLPSQPQLNWHNLTLTDSSSTILSTIRDWYTTSHVDKLIDNEIQKVKLCQFSWVCEGKGDPNKNSPRYKQAQHVAYEVMANDAYNDVLPNSALFFHNLTVDPLWPYKQVAKIGNHIFYSRAKKSTQSTSTKTENNI